MVIYAGMKSEQRLIDYCSLAVRMHAVHACNDPSIVPRKGVPLKCIAILKLTLCIYCTQVQAANR